ncbi:SDR family oxidoreductase, partial [Candidatus Pelagibacter sp.]|nr:SDR family oxidoreductase [Candidatus Pelagibacter sp.]
LKKNNLYLDLNNQLGLAILISQKILRLFKSQGFGNLVFLSSIQGVNAPKFEHYKNTSIVSPIEYSAIKAGIIAITKYLSKYFKKSNIRVNSISPGGILDNQPKNFLKNYKKSCNDKGLLDVNDLVGTVLFLTSDHSRYINGQNIIVDDGWTL